MTILTGRNLPKIQQSREPEPSTINEKTIADFTRVVEQIVAGVMPKKNPCPEAKPAEVFRRSAPLSKRHGANISADP
jgi:hypothetical protein